MKRLNTSKPYGTIYGTFTEVPTARYIQEGVYFNGAGLEIGAPEDSLLEVPLAGEPLYPAERLVTLPSAQLRVLARKHGIAWTSKDEVLGALQALTE